MAWVLKDEFEDGKLGTADLNPYSAPVGSWPTYSRSIVKTGHNSMHVSTSTSTSAVIYTAGSGAGKRQLVGSLYLYLHTLAAATNTIWSTFTDPNNRAVGLLAETVTGVQYWQSYTTDNNLTNYVQYNGTNAPVTLDTWTLIDFKFDLSANPWTVDFMVNGVAQTQGTRAFAAEDIKQHDVGEINALTLDWYADSIWLNDLPAAYPIGNHSPNFTDTAWIRT